MREEVAPELDDVAPRRSEPLGDLQHAAGVAGGDGGRGVADHV